jgi:hypothetical protein
MVVVIICARVSFRDEIRKASKARSSLMLVKRQMVLGKAPRIHPHVPLEAEIGDGSSASGDAWHGSTVLP